jgi:hypothetical protein
MADNDNDPVANPAYPDQTVQEVRIDAYVAAQLAADAEAPAGALHDAALTAYDALEPQDVVYAVMNLDKARETREQLALLDDPEHPGFVGAEAATLLAADEAKAQEQAP